MHEQFDPALGCALPARRKLSPEFWKKVESTARANKKEIKLEGGIVTIEHSHFYRPIFQITVSPSTGFIAFSLPNLEHAIEG